MKIYILLLLFILSVFSCKKSKDGPVVLITSVDIQLVDDQNKDVIGQVPTVDFNDLKIYYVLNGKKELFYKCNLQYPKGYSILKNPDGEKYVRLFLNTEGQMPITLIQFNEEVVDTVKGELNKKKAVLFLQRFGIMES